MQALLLKKLTNLTIDGRIKWIKKNTSIGVDKYCTETQYFAYEIRVESRSYVDFTLTNKLSGERFNRSAFASEIILELIDMINESISVDVTQPASIRIVALRELRSLS